SLVFAFMHPAVYISQFAAGLLLVCIYRRMGSLRAAIAVHSIYNVALWYPLVGRFVFPSGRETGAIHVWAPHLVCLAIVIVAVPAFFVFGEYTRKARVTGVLAPANGVVKILAQQAGVVEAVHAREGAMVERDAPLMVLGDPRTTPAREELGTAVAARLRERQHALTQQRDHAIAAMRSEQTALALKKAGLERELKQLDAELATQAQRAAIAQEGLARARRLEDIGFLSPAARDREHDTALEQRSRVQGAQRTRTALLSE